MMLLNCGVGEDSWESLRLQGNQTSQLERKSVLNMHWTDWWWSWNSNILATWFKEPTYGKRPWCWEELRAGGKGGIRGWDSWMASLTQWTWVLPSSRRYQRTGKPSVLQSTRSQECTWLSDWTTATEHISDCPRAKDLGEGAGLQGQLKLTPRAVCKQTHLLINFKLY